MRQGSCICAACKIEIKDDLCRFCILRDVDDNPMVLHFHYFAPCWDFERFTKQYANFTFMKGGFSCNEKTTFTQENVTHMQSNVEMWIS